MLSAESAEVSIMNIYVNRVAGLNYLVTQNAVANIAGGSFCNCFSFLGIVVQE